MLSSNSQLIFLVTFYYLAVLLVYSYLGVQLIHSGRIAALLLVCKFVGFYLATDE